MLSDEEFHQLLIFFDRPWSGYRKVRRGVKKRIRRRMLEIGCSNLAAYLELIAAKPEEAQRCEQLLLVSISRFFRDRQLWCFLREQLIPRLINEFPAPLRLWSAGCARGEEAYSLAILWASMTAWKAASETSSETASETASPPVEILATDTQRECLNHAAVGIYNRSSLKEVSDELRDRFFKALRGGRQFAIRTESVPPIQWQEHNLLDPPPTGPFHLILLRNNLLTYHQGAELSAAVAMITAELVPGGYLVVGSHEKLPQLPSRLQREALCPWIYRG